MIRLYGLVALLNLVLLVVALIDCIATEEFAVRNLPKIVWVLLILLFSPIGAIIWFVAGRPQHAATGSGAAWRPGSGFPEAERPRPARTLAPDDDPAFLRSLARSRREDEDLLRRWEEDLKRREEELKKKSPPSE
ncbi:PLD nuclease N-terminal domain-containing protein [Catenuloplanes japonicus]|uniref:PLD nuclease N-terminal domain-containing protein n=1 Tax=Catenuloplanes japonicus TaxID=33876 RepID=UPI00052724C0|nr:PLD nuclease N-terminal domain-containing protein [Catenuloplanes japonicus]